MGKKKIKAKVTANDTSGKVIDLGTTTVTIEKPHGKIENGFWVWPDGKRTHMRFIAKAVSKYKNLPLGFYKEALKQNSHNMNLLVAKAKSLELKDNVEKP